MILLDAARIGFVWLYILDFAQIFLIVVSAGLFCVLRH